MALGGGVPVSEDKRRARRGESRLEDALHPEGEVEKPWGGSFGPGGGGGAERFTASIGFDRRLWREDIRGSVAYARALARAGILTPEEEEKIVQGLEEIGEEIARGEFPFRREFEDIHMNVEARLREKIGEVAGKLHTGRSRNDQVALDFHLYLREEIREIRRGILGLEESLLAKAREVFGWIMPGYTHLQRAQPVLLSHHLLAHRHMLSRDDERFRDCLSRLDFLPLGAGALSGNPFPVDREFLCRELGFSRIYPNSIQAVSDRDYAAEFLSAAAILMTHLSRLAGEVVLWSTEEFGFVELPEAFSTGSSLMPQKRNPDVAELVRAKAGRVFGHLMGLLSVLKGLPLAYNSDLQEDKEAVFDTADTVKACLGIMSPFVREIRFHRERMRQAAGGFCLATELADYLVTRGLPFRQAHRVVGELVRDLLARGRTLEAVTWEELRARSPLFGEDAREWLSPEAAVRRRDFPGGTAPRQVEAELERAEKEIRKRREELGE